MKKIFNHYKFLLIGIVIVAASCQKMSYDQQFTSTYPVNGEWTVNYEYGGTVDGPHALVVYNTSFSKDSVWFEEHYWPFKFKAKANVTDLTTATFSCTNAPSKYSTTSDVVTITVGKIVNRVSIYLEFTAASDPNTPYKIYGHRKNNS